MWAEQLLSMYINWAKKQGYIGRVVEKNLSANGGTESATIEFEFEYAYGFLSGERGVHCMIRSSRNISIQNGVSLLVRVTWDSDHLNFSHTQLWLRGKKLIFSPPPCPPAFVFFFYYLEPTLSYQTFSFFLGDLAGYLSRCWCCSSVPWNNSWPSHKWWGSGFFTPFVTWRKTKPNWI